MSRTGDPGLTWRPPAVLDHPAVRAGAWALGAALVLVVVFHFLLPRQVRARSRAPTPSSSDVVRSPAQNASVAFFSSRWRPMRG